MNFNFKFTLNRMIEYHFVKHICLKIGPFCLDLIMNVKEQIELVNSTQSSNITVDIKCDKRMKSICYDSFNQKISAHESEEDFDHLLWQVSHENINVFRYADGGFFYIFANFSHFLPSGVCRIYKKRPWVCREYSNDFCKFDESIKGARELWFSSHNKLEEFCRKIQKMGKTI